MKHQELLLWIDLEMTGLNVATDLILEVAAVLTSADSMQMLHDPLHFVVHQSADVLSFMDPWVAQQHEKSGLLKLVAASEISISSVDQALSKMVHEFSSGARSLILCGNSVWQDRLFLVKYMPLTAGFLHYRMIDVSAIKELVRRWYPDDDAAFFQKADVHRAINDIQESIAELHHYKKYFFKK